MVFFRRRPLVETGTSLADIAEGEIVRINESGSPVEFYVAKHDYESGLNGTGRTLLVRQIQYTVRPWGVQNNNAYASSLIDTWFNDTYKPILDEAIREAISTTTFYYTIGQENYTVDTLSRDVFALSLTELGLSSSEANIEGSSLPIAATLRSLANYQWTRTPSRTSVAYAKRVYGATEGNGSVNNSHAARPCFTLPSDITVGENNLIA